MTELLELLELFRILETEKLWEARIEIKVTPEIFDKLKSLAFEQQGDVDIEAVSLAQVKPFNKNQIKLKITDDLGERISQ